MIKFQYIILIIAIFFFAACDRKNKENTKINSTQINNTITNDTISPIISIQDGKPMVIDFSASWCPPCQQLKPIYAKLTNEFKDQITMITVDVDENPEMAAQFNVKAIPTIIFFDKNGKIIDTNSGFIPENELRNKLNSLL
ncbi:MAG: thioredoxin family protein [Prevotella sp.]|nr:thioredoxin family protein [Bacteroides sp.]MCM1367051.1 thioredoxin family protein [Prevotella sp.]